MYYEIEIKWKSYKLWIPAFSRWLKSNAPGYNGLSAGRDLTVHFSEEPSQTIKDRIQMYLDATTEDGEKNLEELDNKRDRAKQIATGAIPTMSWESMIPAERKIVMKQELSTDDLDALIVKYMDQLI